VHSFHVSELKRDFARADAPIIAPEFITTSITSQAWSQERVNRLLPDNPHILLADGRYRGYTRVRLTRERWRADLRIVDTVQRRDANCSTLATYIVENGRPAPLKA
jgi:alkaline phosphatase D